MRQVVIGLVLIFFSTALKAQYYDSLMQKAFSFSQEKHYAASQELVEKVRGALPETMNVYILASHNLLHLGQVDNAGPYITIGLQLDPSSYSMFVNCALYFAAKGNEASAQSYLKESLKVFPANYTMQEAKQDIVSVGQVLHQTTVFNNLASWYESQQSVITQRYVSLDEVNNHYAQLAAQNPAGLMKEAQRYATLYEQQGWHEMALAAYGHAANWLRGYGNLSQALEIAQSGYAYYYKNGYRQNALMASFMLYQLIKSYEAVGNFERVIQYVEELTTVATKCDLHVYDILGLLAACAAYDGLNKPEEAKTLAGLTVQFAQKYGFGYALVLGYEAVFVNAFKVGNFSPTETVNYGELAQRYAFSYHFEDVGYRMYNYLAIAYLRLKTLDGQKKCFTTLGGLVKYYKSIGAYNQASETLNNYGAIIYHTGQDYAEAAKTFEESIRLAEREIGNLSYEDKLSFYQAQVSAYEFLTASYAHLNQPAKAFQSMEASRSRVLTERLAGGKSVKRASLTDLQNMLAPDEACLMYSLFSGYEVAILVVTKKSAQVVFHTDNTFIGDIKDKYLDRMNKEHGERTGAEQAENYDPERRVQVSDFNKVTQLTRKFFERPGMADNVLQEYLRGYYRFLIVPVINRLSGIKKLLISPDGVLNFLPYEALMMHDGKYLVEKYDVKYLHSVGALQQLQQRNYTSSRKNMLAMGGPVFENMNATPMPYKTQKDMNQLQIDVAENVKRQTSQRRAYATIFGTAAMTALPGTLAEVKNIAAVVPGAEVFTESQMTENRIKNMSVNGQLGNYKILHLATHGFVVNDIPDLSGVAMSIFANEQGGEDGYLTVNELANLKLQSDLTVLSACQTALGKIYSGEGVTGLTQSLLVAGSNAALVSLWPVNDNSTMQFMTGLYKESVKGKDYVPIINDLKRKFIKGEFGEQFKHPNYWAPFVYYGR